MGSADKLIVNIRLEIRLIFATVAGCGSVLCCSSLRRGLEMELIILVVMLATFFAAGYGLRAYMAARRRRIFR